MKKFYFIFLCIFGISNAFASQKYLVCSGMVSMTYRVVDDETRKEIQPQQDSSWEKSLAYVLKDEMLYDVKGEKIVGCKITQYFIECIKDLKGSLLTLEINRINGAIKEINVYLDKYITESSAGATATTRTRFDGYCELKNNTKF